MDILRERVEELERLEFQMGPARGKLALALDVLTDALVLVGQHGVYCASTRNPSKPAMDLQLILAGLEGAKELIQGAMSEIKKS
ncbi:MAG: hypothetical protein ACK58M_27605 [Acidobacteriota bacterium]|jgi:hypothetical protein|nr:hypothetical protein [Bryobacteraceae bacterium CoA2 C42]MCA2962838.1 hypothetical protein [Acidobacteriaceae bacterium]